jgi:hypothetical protein
MESDSRQGGTYRKSRVKAAGYAVNPFMRRCEVLGRDSVLCQIYARVLRHVSKLRSCFPIGQIGARNWGWRREVRRSRCDQWTGKRSMTVPRRQIRQVSEHLLGSVNSSVKRPVRRRSTEQDSEIVSPCRQSFLRQIARSERFRRGFGPGRLLPDEPSAGGCSAYSSFGWPGSAGFSGPGFSKPALPTVMTRMQPAVCFFAETRSMVSTTRSGYLLSISVMQKRTA